MDPLGGLGWALLASTLVSVLLLLYATGHRDKTAGTPLLFILLGAAIWSGAILVEILVESYALELIAHNFIYVGIPLLVASYLVFALEYAGREDLVTPRTYALLAIEPVLLQVFVWANPNDLFRTGVQPGPRTVEFVGSGMAFWLHTAYSYTLILVATVILLRAVLTNRSTSVEQIAAVVVAIAAPNLSNVLYLFTPVDVDLTPVAFSITGVALFVAITRFRFIDVAPIARSRLVSTLSDAVLVVDTDDRVVDVNPACADRFEVDREGVLGEPVADALPRAADLLGAVDEDEGSSVVTVETDGQRQFLDVRASPVRDDEGTLVGHLYVFHDVTEQKRRENELERQNRRLDEFAGLLSHDLRNPLNVAMGRLGVARDTGDLDHLDHVADAHDRIEKLIDDALVLAREGKDIEDPERVDLATVAWDAWQHVETGDASLTVDADLSLLADPSRLSQLLENLYRNAVEHGGETVELTVEPLADSRGFGVSDDGPGIPAARREEVLEPGVSSSDTGTGFGLAIVSAIAEAHGWTVTVTESESGGARFEFSVEDVPSLERGTAGETTETQAVVDHGQ
ncbi:histidine kinase N-terminal 7TM domain-containing protein [Halobacteriales archaeon Cl-PHB]